MWPRNLEILAINLIYITDKKLNKALVVFLTCGTTSCFFLGLVVQKERYDSSCYLEVIDHLRCFFVVINENKPALIIGSQLNPFFCDDELLQMGRLRSAVQLNTCLQFCQSSRDLAFPDKILSEKKNKSHFPTLI